MGIKCTRAIVHFTTFIYILHFLQNFPKITQKVLNFPEIREKTKVNDSRVKDSGAIDCIWGRGDTEGIPCYMILRLEFNFTNICNLLTFLGKTYRAKNGTVPAFSF